ncbi:conserved hypothetical protein [Tenacibaculum litopenaei]
MLLCCLYLTVWGAKAQSRPPVLILRGANEYTTHFDTQNKLTTQLLNAGTQGQGTVEFWVMKAHTQSLPSQGANGVWRLSNLQTGAEEFSLEGADGQLTVKLGATSQTIALEGAHGFWNNTWRHVAFAINKQAGTIRLYVDGVQRANLVYPAADYHPEQLYMMVTADDQLSVAEYRAWNRVRTLQQIADSKALTFSNENGSNLDRLGSNGLVVAYAADNSVESRVSNLPLMQTHWNNMINASLGADVPKAARVTSSIIKSGGNDLKLAELTTNADHPIYSLKDVLLYASDGEGRTSAGKPVVRLRWPHISGATSYIVSRRNLADPLSNFSDIQTYTPTSNNAVSSYLTYDDNGILPNELYEYQVKAEGVTGSKPGKDNGFVFANGVVKGSVETPKRIATQDVLIAATANSGVIPGKALQFVQNSNPIQINDVSLFEQAQGTGTIEFWYRTPAQGVGTNTVFKLSDGEIRISEAQVQVISRNPQNPASTITYLTAAKPNDTHWHHYAVTFSPTGGALFIDGGVKQPTNKEQPIVANATTAQPFVVGLARTSLFSFNAKATTTYEMDEVRIWSTKKNATEIFKFWQYILGANTATDLLAYYRFDMNDPRNVYNQAGTTLGRFRGVSRSPLKTVAQPYQRIVDGDAVTQVPIHYGVYTNSEGLYRFTSLNSGRQDANVANNYLTYRIKPTKPNNEFSPESERKNIERTLAPGEPNPTNFTNISSYDISGKVVYVTTVPGQAEKVEFPTVQNTGVFLDGTEVTSTEVGSLVRTNNQGVFRISGAPGKHRISIGQPKLEKSSVAIDRISLDFKSKGYAVSKANIANAADEGFTWTGFVKPDANVPTVGSGGSSAIPAKQTVLHWGAIQLELRNNNELVLMSKGADLLSKAIEGNSQYNFFGITKDVTNNVIGLWVNDDYQTHAYTGEAIDSKLYLGASYVSPTEMSNHAIANIDLIEYRNSHYTSQELSEIKSGNVVAKDKEHLKLAYNFEHTSGTRAVNLALSTGTANNYLSLHQGAYFNNKSRANYIRKFAFDYKAFESGDAAALVNPKNDKEYLFNLTEPTGNINFENITRRSFVGNVVIPCNNNVGNWTGKIIRTDVQFPRYERAITASNFNDENNLFTVHDLLPGQYRVEITREGTTDKVQSSIIDLRTGNKSYDFPYRNDLEIDLALYSVTKEEVEGITSMDQLASKRINPTCGADQSIYKLEAGKSILAVVSVYEDYNGSKCPVDNATVNLNGDLIIAPTNGKTGDNGKKSFLTFAGNPNFIGDYLRNMAIVVSHNNRTKTVTKSAYVTGARRGNEDFTLTDPTVGFVLYDPPGDASSATLARGATYSFSKSVGGGLDLNTATEITVGSDIETQMVSLAIAAPLGVGIGQGIIYTVVEQESKFTGNIDANFTYRHTEQNGTSVSLEQSISTSSAEDIVGADADVFIGASRVLTFGTGMTLRVDSNCMPVIDTDKKVMTADKLTPFVYTRQDIEDRIIRNLQDLLIKKHDELFPPTAEEIAKRSSLNYQATIDAFNINSAAPETDRALVNYVFQINRWKQIVQRKTRAEQLTYMNEQTKTFASTTADLKAVGSGLGSSVTQLDSQVSFSGGTSTTYTLTRGRESSNQDSGGSTFGGGTTFNNSFNIAGVAFSLKTDIKTLGVVEASDNNANTNGRVDSFTLSDGDVGDQFSVRIARDKVYDTPVFYTVAGQSVCPFESGTVPREGVEITVDSAVKYGTGGESILYNLTLRNTQIANDATRKVYIVGMNGASNSKGAQVFLNESPIFEPATTSPINFGLDGNSPTGVQREVKAQLRIARGMDAPEEISYENIGIRIYSACEQAGDGYRSYRVDEYNEVGVVPFQEIFVTAHFKGACVSEIQPDLPANNWVVNNTSQNQLKFRFRIPEVVNNQVDEKFTVALEYALPGNSETFELKKLSLTELKENMDATTGFISYTADVSGLSDGEYRFRIAPVCDDGGANLPASRKNPTTYVTGRIARSAPTIISTNPVNGGVLTQGQITAEFNRAINPLTAVNSSFSLRGILGGVPKDLISAEFDNVNDVVTIPHQQEFNLENKKAFTVEMWVNPSSLPTGATVVPILKKGSNYNIGLNAQGNIVLNNTVVSSRSLQPFNWTHVAVTYDGNQTATIYYNGVSAGSGSITALTTNADPIEIAKNEGGNSYVGKLDEVRIWTIQRTPTDIVAKMDEQLIGNELNLVAYFVFDDNPLKGANGAPDEAIRDYTGNALATTQTGLSFVRGSANAAPLDLTRMAKDLQFTVTTSHNDTQVHLTPVFDASFVEGAQLTAMVLNRRLEDPSRNKIAGKAWSFVVNKNTIGWSQNNIRVTQAQGTSTKISTIDLDNSKGGTPVKYRFKQLPSWLSVEKNGTAVEENSFQDLATGFVERDLDFVVAPYLNPGVHATDVYIEVIQRVNNKDVPIGVEAFHLEVEVTCAAPDFAGNFNSNNYFGSMSISGNLVINGEKSVDTGDIVAAYLNEEFRGQTTVTTGGLVNLSIFGNNGETGLLTFKVWDASACTEYQGIVESYNYAFRSRIGSVSAPVNMTVGSKISKRIALATGFQELSFNLRDNRASMNLSLQAIKGLTAGDQIYDTKSGTLLATVAANGSFILNSGATNQLDTRKAYTVKASGAKLISIEGIHVPVDTDIPVLANADTAIPYFPTDLQTLPIALRSLNSTTVSIGDRIERRGLQAEYTADGWKGSLTHMTPTLGYIYRASRAGVLNYSGIANTPAPAARGAHAALAVEDYLDKAAKLNWKVDRNAYPSFMYMVATLDSETLDLEREHVVAAFVDGKISGIAKPMLIDGAYHYFVGIGGFAKGAISFKLYDGESIVSLDNALEFERSAHVGTVENPFVLRHTAKPDALVDALDTAYSLGQNEPNPMTDRTQITFQVAKDEYVELSLYNVLGQRVHTFVAEEVKGGTLHKVQWNLQDEATSFKSGVYIYKLQTASKTLSRKLIIK